MYKLHATCLSGNCYKVALALDVMGQPWEGVSVDYVHGETRTPEWRGRFNDLGEVPVLEDGHLRLSQSGAILLHLAKKHKRFGGGSETQEREVLRWILFDNHKFTSYFGTYRWMKAFTPSPPNPDVMAFLRGRFETAFALVNAHLTSREFIAGDILTVADLSMSGYLFYPPQESGYDVRAEHPAIARWLGRIQSLPGWRDPYDCLPGDRIPPLR